MPRAIILTTCFCLSSLVGLISDTSRAADLTGVVVDANASPVSGATIEVRRVRRSVRADSAGAFLIPDIPSGDVWLEVSAVGFESMVLRADTSDETNPSIQVRLEIRPWRIGDITVSATRSGGRAFDVPRTVNLLSTNDLTSHQVSSLADGLAYEPGVTVQKTTHGHGSPIIGGLVGNYVLLSYNGIRLNNSTFRHGPNQYLNNNDIDAVDKIEVIAGPTSVLYGSDAIGGTINLVNERPFSTSRVLRISPSFTTRFSTADHGIRQSLRLSMSNDKVSLRGGGAVASYGDLRAGGNIGNQRPTGWDEHAFDGTFAVTLSNKASLSGSHFSVRQQDMPRYDKYIDGGMDQYLYDPQARDLSLLAIDVSDATGWCDSAHFGISYHKVKEGITEQKTGSAVVRNSMDEVTTIGVSGQGLSQVGSRHFVIHGGEYYHDKVVSHRYESDGASTTEIRSTFPDGATFWSYGLYLQDRWQFTRNTDLVLGLRYSRFNVSAKLEQPFGDYSDDIGDLTGSISIITYLGQHQNLYFSAARGFRAPNLDDAVVLRTTNNGIDAPSPDLAPEKSCYLEMGTKYESSLVSSSVSAFANFMSDLIDRVPGYYLGLTFVDENANGVQDAGEIDVFQRDNVGKALLYGAIGRLAWEFYPDWVVKVYASWHYGENTTSDEPLSRVPPATLYLGLSREFYRSVSVACFMRAAAAQTRLSARDLNDSRIGSGGTPGWSTLNLSATYQWRNLRGAFLFENLFDELYKTHGSGIYAPGRSVSLCVQWR